ncbi:hypothetical protein LDENG_00158380 [Lucifuga dentata]|nr:hypothetical protein LDENG_00158380 [Lucifuga dentata]
MPLRTSLYRKPASARWPGRSSRRKDMLSVNKISLPLADFCHISHIGNDAHTDSFGDLSFLKMGHSLLLQSSQSEQNLFLACSPPPKPPRLNLDEEEAPDNLDWPMGHQQSGSQRRKKCSSLPLLDSEEGEGELERDDMYQRGFPVGQTHSPGCGSLNSDRDGDSTGCEKTTGQLKDEDSGFSFSLDLGPSILDDVLQVMEKLHY